MSKLNPHHEDDPWSDLVVSILSVNRFTLEQTYGLLERLQAEKLTDPEELSQRSAAELYVKLKAAGYDRGEFMTHLFAERLACLGSFVKNYGVARCIAVMKSRDPKTLESLLLPINGIGPAVMRNYYCLREILK